MRRRAWMFAAGVFGLAVAVVECSAAGRRLSRRVARRVTRTARYETGRLAGVRYRMAGGTPDIGATDGVLADRVRSVLGPLEHRLDVPRVHVMAHGHDVMLHGDVGSADQRDRIVAAVEGVVGVGRVDSHLHVGYARGDTRPSEGAGQRPRSAALHSVLAAAHGAGVEPGGERAAARAVLSTFMGLLPDGERRHVLSHLPADLRALAQTSGGITHRPPRHLDDFAMTALPTMAPDIRRSVVESVLGATRDLVPEEAMDVAAVLPDELAQVWKTAIPL